jgi:hypothetical protein
MGEQTDGRPADHGHRFTDRGKRFTDRGQDLARRRFLGKAGIAALAVGTGVLLAGCTFDHGPYQGYDTDQGNGTGQSSTSGQNATSGQGKDDKSQNSSGSQSGMSS